MPTGPKPGCSQNERYFTDNQVLNRTVGIKSCSPISHVTTLPRTIRLVSSNFWTFNNSSLRVSTAKSKIASAQIPKNTMLQTVTWNVKSSDSSICSEGGSKQALHLQRDGNKRSTDLCSLGKVLAEREIAQTSGDGCSKWEGCSQASFLLAGTRLKKHKRLWMAVLTEDLIANKSWCFMIYLQQDKQKSIWIQFPWL